MMTFKDFRKRVNLDYTLVIESPQIVNSFKFNPEDYQYVVNSKENTLIDTIKGLGIYKRKIGHGNMYLAISNDKLVYISNVFSNPLSAMKIQFQVWRDKTVNETLGIPIEVFFKHIIKDHKLIFTDNEQTVDGKRLWENIIIRGGKDSKYEIGIITPREHILFDPKENIVDWLKKYRAIIWGKDIKYKEVVAYITTNKGAIR